MAEFRRATEVTELDMEINRRELAEEDIWCVHKYLDDLEIPRGNDDGTFSIVGRIKVLQAQQGLG